jgi:hypothetical protein
LFLLDLPSVRQSPHLVLFQFLLELKPFMQLSLVAAEAVEAVHQECSTIPLVVAEQVE